MSDVFNPVARTPIPKTKPKSITILLVEDDPGDVLLTREAIKRAKVCNTMYVARDGVEALSFLKREGEHADKPRPDLILLDLNMPRMDGVEFLEIVKKDERFLTIPVVMLTTSDAERDVYKSYKLAANCYITKPVDLQQFTKVIGAIEEFWLSIVKLPPANLDDCN